VDDVFSQASSVFVLRVKINPITSPRGLEGSRKLRFPDYVTVAQNGSKVVSLTHEYQEIPLVLISVRG